MTEMELLEQTPDLRVWLVQNGDHPNPRLDSDPTVWAVNVPDHNYLDAGAPGPLSDKWDRLMRSERYHWSDAVDVFMRWARIFHGAVCELDTPHQGARVVWYVTAADIAEHGYDPAAAIESARQEYRWWAEGEVYGHVIEERKVYVPADGSAGTLDVWREVESCWGFIGYDYAKREALTAYHHERLSWFVEGTAGLNVLHKWELSTHMPHTHMPDGMRVEMEMILPPGGRVWLTGETADGIGWRAYADTVAEALAKVEARRAEVA